MESGAFDELVSLRKLYLQGNHLTTMSSELLANVPDQLQLSLSDPDQSGLLWNCTSLCWLKETQMDDNWINSTCWNGSAQFQCWHKPLCVEGVKWDIFPCGDQGRKILLF